ncbi:MAG: hypothetical protein ABIA63_03235, partial [bacterium]
MKISLKFIIAAVLVLFVWCSRNTDDPKIPESFYSYYIDLLFLNEKYVNSPDSLKIYHGLLLKKYRLSNNDLKIIKLFFLKSPRSWIKFQE